MDLVRNPQLGHMSADDLAQRYADTYCVYFGKPVYIYGFFHNNDGDILIETAEINLGNNMPKPVRDLFRWELLNIARPQAGWYTFERKGKVYPYHLSYPVKRQYKRGCHVRNTFIFCPYVTAGATGVYYHNALVAPDAKYIHITDEMLNGQGTVILRPDRILNPTEKHWEFWFHKKLVAQIIHTDNRIVFLEKGFEQELFEVSRSMRLDHMKVEYGQPPVITPVDLGKILRAKLEAHWEAEEQEPREDEEEVAEVMFDDVRPRDDDPILHYIGGRRSAEDAMNMLTDAAINRLRSDLGGGPINFKPLARVELEGYPEGFLGFYDVKYAKGTERQVIGWMRPDICTPIVANKKLRLWDEDWIFNLVMRNEGGDNHACYMLVYKKERA